MGSKNAKYSHENEKTQPISVLIFFLHIFVKTRDEIQFYDFREKKNCKNSKKTIEWSNLPQCTFRCVFFTKTYDG